MEKNKDKKENRGKNKKKEEKNSKISANNIKEEKIRSKIEINEEKILHYINSKSKNKIEESLFEQLKVYLFK
jgi:hypothetical protein